MEELEGVKGEETVIRIHCMRKNIFLINGKKSKIKSKNSTCTLNISSSWVNIVCFKFIKSKQHMLQRHTPTYLLLLTLVVVLVALLE